MNTGPCKRQRQRLYPQDTHVLWSSRNGVPLMKAEVKDVSDSGLGLLITGRQTPTLGEAINVASTGDASPRRARVLRVAKADSGRVSVGCRWISSKEHHAVSRSTRR